MVCREGEHNLSVNKKYIVIVSVAEINGVFPGSIECRPAQDVNATDKFACAFEFAYNITCLCVAVLKTWNLKGCE